ncbi:RNA polymerase sigma factor [Parabacteroides goldsteinii]|uniref:RNA polymerase sigma factor n=1 Tax=Parabacteroides goldsteinii TaxID=328812 RepID=UPI003993C07D
MKYIVSDGMKSEMRYVELSDAQLWKLIIEKDKVAFEQLYRRYYSPLLAYALSFCNDEEMAKDCIQDLFVKLFVSETLSSIEYIRAYLYKSLRNLLLDKSSRVVGSVSLEENMVADFLVEDVELVRLFEKEDDYLEKSRLLMNAYNQLSENQRNAIYLYFIKEFSWDEMAVSLDINPHSCMNLVARAVAKLQRMVAGEKKK